MSRLLQSTPSRKSVAYLPLFIPINLSNTNSQHTTDNCRSQVDPLSQWLVKYPHSYFPWLHSLGRMSSFQGEELESRDNVYRRIKGILRIHNLRHSDAGRYSCEARSDLDIVKKLQAVINGEYWNLIQFTSLHNITLQYSTVLLHNISLRHIKNPVCIKKSESQSAIWAVRSEVIFTGLKFLIPFKLIKSRVEKDSGISLFCIQFCHFPPVIMDKRDNPRLIIDIKVTNHNYVTES